MPKVFGILTRITLTAALCAAVFVPASAADIETQRELFSRVFEDVERGDWGAIDALERDERRLLEEYVLWPDLRGTYLRANLRTTDPDTVESFLDEYGLLKPARELRYRYALELARRGDLARYFEVYEAYYQGMDVAVLDCLALRAEINDDRGERVVARAKDLWLVGRSQVDECDPVFAWLYDNELLTALDYRRRFELAIDARQFSLARWLARSIDEAHEEEARHWQSAANNAERFLKTHAQRRSTPVSHQQLAYAAERLTYADPVRAAELWAEVDRRYPIAEELRARTLRHIALWTARDNLPGAYTALVSLPAAAQDDEVVRWRARTSLRSERWTALLDDIAAMSADEKASEEWRYWRAIALKRSGQVLAARAYLAELAEERSYYGFLAADELGLDYSLEHAALDVDATALEALAMREDLIRARELFFVGQDGRGRSEWDAAIAWFSPEQKAQAAILADRWGWHSRAIATVGSIGEFDDLALRYPLPYRNEFSAYSEAAAIPANWAYSVARSESLFMRDVRSGAGAIGLMQLMPATGRSVARDVGVPYRGLDTLTNPESNIRLGTTYLARMAERYGGNRVLATAAYNAGPHRVDRWIPEQGTIDARIWIENIPFNETRGYVRRVMAAKTIFHWRMNGDVRRLSDELPLIEATPDVQRVSAR
ncbi:MAG: transglycosylase SLT domain-containing protein [Woeseiaceae bacterium]|nr:transglycosylase SLT domain-containing protein [Woeseiaceae bacterium]